MQSSRFVYIFEDSLGFFGIFRDSKGIFEDSLGFFGILWDSLGFLEVY